MKKFIGFILLLFSIYLLFRAIIITENFNFYTLIEYVPIFVIVFIAYLLLKTKKKSKINKVTDSKNNISSKSKSNLLIDRENLLEESFKLGVITEYEYNNKKDKIVGERLQLEKQKEERDELEKNKALINNQKNLLIKLKESGLLSDTEYDEKIRILNTKLQPKHEDSIKFKNDEVETPNKSEFNNNLLLIPIILIIAIIIFISINSYLFKVPNDNVEELQIDNVKELPIISSYGGSNIEWIGLLKGDLKNDFGLSQNNTLQYNGESFNGDIAKKSYDKVRVSPPSNYKDYIICSTFENDNGYYYLLGIYFCDLKKMESYLIDLNDSLLWCSWSPSNDNIILSTFYEDDMHLYNYNIGSRSLEPLDFSKDIIKDQDDYWVEWTDFELDSLIWVNKTSFQVIVNIKCSRFGDASCSKEWERSITYVYDILKNKIISTSLNP